MVVTQSYDFSASLAEKYYPIIYKRCVQCVCDSFIPLLALHANKG